MSLKLSTKKARRYNARQLKKWHAKRLASVSAFGDMEKKKVVTIDLAGVKSVKDFYQRLVAQVDLPEYCAINLDALHDVLLGDVSESLVFSWATVAEDVAHDPEALEGLKRMLEDLPQARAEISISYRGCSN